MKKPLVFEYTDYRRYLRDYYEAMKASRRPWSYSILAQKAGFVNKGFVYNVIHGIKNLSKASAVKLSEALGHGRAEAEYFENLVFFNQAKSHEDKERFLKALNGVVSRNGAAGIARTMRKDQYEFYSSWHHSAIRSLIGMYPFAGDYDWLARNVYPPITRKQAKDSVALLVRLGLAKRLPDGRFELSETHITTGEEILDTAALHYHRDTARLGMHAMDKLDKEVRNITGLCMGISGRAYRQVVDEIRMLRGRLVEIACEDEEPDRVYQLNLHLFPLSRTEIRRNWRNVADDLTEEK